MQFKNKLYFIVLLAQQKRTSKYIKVQKNRIEVLKTKHKNQKKIEVTSINRLGKLHKYNFEQDWKKKILLSSITSDE